MSKILVLIIQQLGGGKQSTSVKSPQTHEMVLEGALSLKHRMKQDLTERCYV